MKRKNLLPYITALVILSITAFRVVEDPLFLKDLKQALNQYNRDFPEEKVYVHLDKPFYKPGEDLWFNVFVLNSDTHKPTSLSDVVYVELLDPKGNIASKVDLVVREGTAHGDFALNSAAPGGIYQIRAYTNWMKNFGKENFFRKEIQVQRIITPRLLLKLDFEKESYGAGEEVQAKLTIRNLKNETAAHADMEFSVKVDGKEIFSSQGRSDANGVANIMFTLPDSLATTDGLLTVKVKSQGTEESIARSVPIILNRISIQFLPEGGSWMLNASSKIAFKAVNEFGKGADVAGAILDQDNNVVAHFESFHMGMGAFTLKPETNTTYFARIDRPAGNASLVRLPDPINAGLVMNVAGKSSTTVTWSIHSSTSTNVYLVGQSHGQINYAQQIKLNQGENTITHSTTDFPAGIAVFTLFGLDGVERCERLIFLNHHKHLKVDLKTDKETYQPGEMVKLDIKTLDDKGKPVPSKLSIAVVDDQMISYADDKQDNILSSLLLSSEVKGEIQEPAFYFDPNEPKADAALDHLLKTQGWRRFRWKDVYDRNRPITHIQEKNTDLAGRLLDDKGAGLSGEVTLLELGGRQRIIKVETTREGHFVFKKIDPTISLLLLTRKPGEIDLQNENSLSISLNDQEGTIILSEIRRDVDTSTSIEGSEAKLISAESALDIGLASDVSELSEVIVTAFGTERKQALAGSVTVIQENETLFGDAALENTLQGRVAGVVIQPQTGSPASNSNIIIRGVSSLAGGRNEPLYVIDGHPIGTSLNPNFSNGSLIGPDDIQSIEVINSPEAPVLYGSAAANGVILITTRSRIGYQPFKSNNRRAKYSSLTVTPRKFSATREFYVPKPTTTKNETRKDFRNTVYWNHTIVTGEDGKANISFKNNDAVSAFRITAEGFSHSGLVGRKEKVYHTELPLSLDVKLPEYLGYEDVLKLPVRVRNETASVMSTDVIISVPAELEIDEAVFQRLELQPRSTGTLWFTIRPRGIEGELPISIKLASPDYVDEINHVITVRPIGFPVRLSLSAKELDKTFDFSIRDAERTSVKAELTAFPDVLSNLFTGAESILREPHGCFEQVSSSTFPNILALQFIKQSGLSDPAIEGRALRLIEAGYARLAAYEIKGGGFEWFGHPPAHEGLTAYGLLQFHEMKKVLPGVNQELMDRTRAWLLQRRTGKGGYTQNSGKYGFSGASQAVTNAYITFVLSETGTNDILPEYQQSYNEALKSHDMYRMALVALTAFNLGRIDDYEKLTEIFKNRIETSGLADIEAEHSIVRSYDRSLEVEVISLWAIALMKSSSNNLVLINACINHILSKRAYGQFGSTQATALALKAMTEYARLMRTTRDDGEIQIFVDDISADNLVYGKERRDKITLSGFANKLEANGTHTMRIRFKGTTEPLPYSLDMQWRTKTPPSSAECKVKLATALSAASVKLNESVRLTAHLNNKADEGLPMTVAVIGIPAGLSAQPWQLKELQEKNVFDFYEISGGNVVIYYREMAPNGHRTINLDLKAEIPGSYVGGASSAYLYYTNEYKHWVEGKSIVID